MKLTRSLVSTSSLLAVAWLSGCGAGAAPSATVEAMPPAPPPTAVGKASGKGVLEFTRWSEDPNKPPQTEKVDFEPAFAYAWPATGSGGKTLWIVLTDQAPDTAAIDTAENRDAVLSRSCAEKRLRYTALHVDAKGNPVELRRCSGDGSSHTAMLGPDMVMGDRASIKLDVNDGKRLEGGMTIGVGIKRVGDVESFDETTGEYRFDVTLSPPTLRDRVLAGGDEHASGVAGARFAYEKYFAAAGASKSLKDIESWLTPERRANGEEAAAQMAKVSPKFAARMFEHFVEAHAKAPTITGAKAIGAAAVITSQMQSGSRVLTCQTLMLQIAGAWKAGDEGCEAPGA